MKEAESYENWEPVFSTGLDYEAELVCDRLRDAGIPTVVLNKRDHAFHLNWGDLAQIKVLVPQDREEEAMAVLEQQPFTDKELTDAALAADPVDEDLPDDDEDTLTGDDD